MIDNPYPPAFSEMLEQYIALRQAERDGSSQGEAKQVLTDRIWRDFGATRTVVVSDMSGFTRLTRQYGILHYLALIHELRGLAMAAVSEHHGHMVKWEGDNMFAHFTSSDDAVGMALALRARLKEINRGRHEDSALRMAFGMDRGKVLLLGDHEFYGDPINIASKLGEDVGSGGDLLISERVYDDCALPDKRARFLREEAMESRVSIAFYRFSA